MHAADQRRAALQVSADERIVELVRVDHRVRTRERVAEPALDRRIALEQIRRDVHRDAVERTLQLVARGEDVYLDAGPDECRGACLNVRCNAAVPRPERRDEQNGSCHPRDRELSIRAGTAAPSGRRADAR